MFNKRFFWKNGTLSLLLFFVVYSSAGFLNAQSPGPCSPFYFEVCKVLPDVNTYPPAPSNPGPFHGYYKVKLKSSAGTFPNNWEVNYLAFSGKVSVNGFTSRINIDLTNQFSQSVGGGLNPYFQYLNITEDGEVDWTVGFPNNCTSGEPGVNFTFAVGTTEIELFTIVVDGVPGDAVNFSGDDPNLVWRADVKDCNLYHCSGTIPILGCTTPANFLISFPAPQVCNPERNIIFELEQILGKQYIQVKLNNLGVNESVTRTDMVILISPQMNGINNLELIPFQAGQGPNVQFWERANTDGSKNIYLKTSNFVATGPTTILSIEIRGQFNLSQGVDLVCTMAPGRGVFKVNGTLTACSLTYAPANLSIPGYSACPSMLNISPTRYTGAGCTLGVKYTISHKAPVPIDLSYLKLRFAFKLTNGNNSPGTPSTNLPCASCGTLAYNSAADTWEYTYEQTTPLSLPSSSEVLIPFNINVDCIYYYIIMAEATPVGGSTCALGVTFDINQWPACDPSIKGNIIVDNGGAPALAPLYKVKLESISEPSYSMFNEDDCNEEYSFCPDPTKAPFQIKLESSSPNAYLCGVTTYDLVLISKHLLNILPFTEPKKWIAADASLLNSGLTTFDLTQIKRCILGITPDFGLSGAPSWWYFKDGYTFMTPNPLNPPYAGSNLSVVPANGLGSYGNFFAVKVGDVNQSCNCGMRLGGEGQAQPFLKVSTTEIKQVGNQVDIPIWSDAPFNPIAVQAGFRFDPSILSLKSVVPNPDLNINNLDFGTNNEAVGELRFAWSSLDAQTPLPKKALLFTLQFEQKNKDDLLPSLLFWTSEDILQNLMYQEDGSEFPIRLNWEEREREHSPSLNLVVSPNPYEDRMSIFVHAEKPTNAIIRLSDGKGFIYSQKTVELHSGDNAVEVQASASIQPGVYFLSVESEGQKLQRRVVKI